MKLLILLGIITTNSWAIDKDYIDCMKAKRITMSCVDAYEQFTHLMEAGAMTPEDYKKNITATYTKLGCIPNGKKYLNCGPKYDRENQIIIN